MNSSTNPWEDWLKDDLLPGLKNASGRWQGESLDDHGSRLSKSPVKKFYKRAAEYCGSHEITELPQQGAEDDDGNEAQPGERVATAILEISDKLEFGPHESRKIRLAADVALGFLKKKPRGQFEHVTNEDFGKKMDAADKQTAKDVHELLEDTPYLSVDKLVEDRQVKDLYKKIQNYPPREVLMSATVERLKWGTFFELARGITSEFNDRRSALPNWEKLAVQIDHRIANCRKPPDVEGNDAGEEKGCSVLVDSAH